MFTLSNLRHLTKAVKHFVSWYICAVEQNYPLQLSVIDISELASCSDLWAELLSWAKWAILQRFSASTVQVSKAYSSQLGIYNFHIYKTELQVVACLQLHVLLEMLQHFCLRGSSNWGRKKIVLLEANLLKWLFFLSSETAFCLMAVNRWSQWSMTSAHKPLTFNCSCKQSTEMTG